MGAVLAEEILNGLVDGRIHLVGSLLNGRIDKGVARKTGWDFSCWKEQISITKYLSPYLLNY